MQYNKEWLYIVFKKEIQLWRPGWANDRPWAIEKISIKTEDIKDALIIDNIKLLLATT
jgi:hypothetical protein